MYALVGLVAFLVAFLVWREWQHTVERLAIEEKHYQERQALLNRLMARDLPEYVNAELASKYQQLVTEQNAGGESDYEVGV